jgi:putative ABC transport system permease protein
MFRRKRKQSDFAAEIEAHLELETEQLKAQGLSEEEARRGARRAFGNVTQAQERFYESGRWLWWDHLAQDLRFGLRMLRKNPGFTAVAVVTLALGIGANTAIFSVVYAVLLRPLPYRDPSQLVWVTEFFPKVNETLVPHPDFFAWREQCHAFESVAAFRGGGDFNLTGHGEPERLAGVRVTHNFFSLLGIRPALGRDFLPEEDEPGGPHVVVLSHALWLRRFGADPAILGKAVTLDGSSHSVVGILPPNFKYPGAEDPAIYVPFGLSSKPNWDRGIMFVDVIARLPHGVKLERVNSELSTVAQRAHQDYPKWFVSMSPDVQVRVLRLQAELVGDFRRVVLVLFGAVGFILLIACANVANLQLAREAARQREIALRAALGAGRSRIARQLLTESVLLAALGAGGGLLLASGGVSLLRRLGAKVVHHLANARVDPWVLAFTAGIAVLTGILFGLAPALVATRQKLNETLKEGGTRTGMTRGRHRLRGSLAVSELALALVLLAGAGLLVRSFFRLLNVDPGFIPENLLTLRIALVGDKYSDAAQQAAFFQRALDRITSLPGVRSAAAASALPLFGFSVEMRVAIEGQPPPPPDQPASVPVEDVTPEYFGTMGIPLIEGRNFTDRDALTTPKVAIVSEAFVYRYFQNIQPIGHRVQLGGGQGDWVTVVGVVGDVRQLGLDQGVRPQVFRPFLQDPQESMTVVVRTNSDPEGLTLLVQNAVWALDKDQPISEVGTMDHWLSDSLASRRLNMLLLGIFAALGLALAAVGIYGVISYSVTQRTHEIGIRMALGARRGDVLQLVVGQGFALTFLGVVIGIAGALGLTRFLSSMLYGIRPADPLTFVGVSMILAGVALLASYIPARRAMKVDPMVALRYE